MKKIARLSGIVMIITIIVITLFACSKTSATFNCGLCGAESNGKQHKVTVMDESIVICDGCYEQLSQSQK